MSVTSIDKDFDSLTFTLVADFDAQASRVWDLWADPRKLEQWWGPPSHPATFEQHDLKPGGEVAYFMTGPEGERHRGWWRVESVDPPRALEFLDGFADADGKPADDSPVTRVFLELTETDGQTRMTLRSVFDSRDEMEEIMKMGAAEGIQQAVSQMDALLTE